VSGGGLGFSLSPLLLPLFFYALSIEKENEQSRGFLLYIANRGAARRAVSVDVATAYA